MLDILIIIRTKLDNTFPVSQFHIDGYSKLYRLDRNRNGDSVILYVREDILGRILTKHDYSDNIGGLFVELKFRKSKWLLGGMCHSPFQPDEYLFNTLGNTLNIYSNYENVLLIGNLNAQQGKPLALSLCG